MNEMKQRARNAMIGLAMGDALSWTAMYHRSYLLPAWTRRIVREMNADAEEKNSTTHPMPFSLNQPADNFDIGPTDDAEWAAFAAQMLLRSGAGPTNDVFTKEWMTLANYNEPIRASIGVQTALQNLRNGILPPHSGKENPQYFDDAAMIRAIPIGVYCSGKPNEAARLASLEASITNSEDGIWAAQAMASAISSACMGKNIEETLNTAVNYLPTSSWIRRMVDMALSLTEGGGSVFSLLPELQNKISNHEYSYGNIAPETLALTFAIVRAHPQNYELAVLNAASFAKNADTLPATVGALAGALSLQPIASASWLRSIETMKGICIPFYKNVSYLSITEQLAENVTNTYDGKK
jgi:ADP-ribosylglycohydrolase